jgi:hypothetical protein
VTVSFLRKKSVTVEPGEGGALRVVWRLDDDLTEAELRLVVQPPDLTITAIEASLPRYAHPGYAEVAKSISRVKGVRISSGLRKIVTGLLPAAPGGDELVQGVLEACNAVILHFTLPHIRAGERMTPEQALAANRLLLQTNPRMLGSCVAWQPGSPLVKALEAEAGGEA